MEATTLSLADHVCLAIVAEGPTHGWAIVKLLAPHGELGRIWSLSRPLTYRAIDRLSDAELIARADAGRRTELRITARGRRVAARWLTTPVEHLRDLRTEFLVKLALSDRAGFDRIPLVSAQRTALAPAIVALTDAGVDDGSDSTTDPPTDPVEMWRHESAITARRFLDRLSGDVQSAP